MCFYIQISGERVDKMISKNARIGDNVTICDGCYIGDNVVIGDNSYIDVGTIIRDDVTLGENTFVGARCILGEYLSDFINNKKKVASHPLNIGKNAVIRSETIMYGDSVVGDFFQTGHRVTIREKAKIADHVKVGTLSDIQGYCEIDSYSSMHSNVHIGQHSKIGKFVMIFPYVVLTNDPTPPSRPMVGVEIDEFAIVATGSVVLPGVHISHDSLIGAGTTVTKDVEAEHIVVGNPGKDVGNVRKIKNKFSGAQVYPWRYSFSEGMPWEEMGFDAWYLDLPESEKMSFSILGDV